jgi:hypothetical protein
MELGYLPDEKQQQMRLQGIIGQDEVAIRVGDVLIAENVITRDRRRVQEPTNEGRRVLKG